MRARRRKFTAGDTVVVSGPRAPRRFFGRYGVVTLVLCGEYVIEFDDDRHPRFGELMSHWITKPDGNVRRELWQVSKAGRVARCIVLERPGRVAEGGRPAVSGMYEVRIVLDGNIIATRAFDKTKPEAVTEFAAQMRQVFFNREWEEIETFPDNK